jgi:hypothetical protein
LLHHLQLTNLLFEGVIMNSYLRNLWSLVSERRAPRKRHSAALAVETLENRCLLSASTAVLPKLPGAPEQVVSSVVSGEGNPYGLAYVPQGFAGVGVLRAGDLLVENFNGVSGNQGTGTTIERITPSGQTSLFFTSNLVGLDTALGVLKAGFVIIGNAPNVGGTTVGQGALQILDANGNVVSTLTDSALLNGPWDLTINDQGAHAQVFVSNVLSGTVTRIDLAMPNHGIPHVLSETQIASGYAHRTDPAALVVGPTGLAFDARTNTLFVASTVDNKIYAIHNAATTNADHGKGTVVVQDAVHLHGPLGLVLAPNGDFIIANGDAVNPGGTPNDLVEYNRAGHFVGSFQVDSGAPGAAFGIATTTVNGEFLFATDNDNANTVEIFTLPIGELRHRDGHR